jgi:hypothetical protein
VFFAFAFSRLWIMSTLLLARALVCSAFALAPTFASRSAFDLFDLQHPCLEFGDGFALLGVSHRRHDNVCLLNRLLDEGDLFGQQVEERAG